jgi:hypothetical protein
VNIGYNYKTMPDVTDDRIRKLKNHLQEQRFGVVGGPGWSFLYSSSAKETFTLHAF